MVKAIMPVLDVIEPEQPEATPTTAPQIFLDKSKNALRWLHSFVKESAEFTGAHVLSLVRAHYPRIELQHLEAGYPQGHTPDMARQLRESLMGLSLKLTGDLKLCGDLPPVQDPSVTPSTSQADTTVSLEKAPTEKPSTSQTPR